MAILSKGKTFTNGELVTPQKLHELVDLGTVSGIVNADIANNAAIADSKLAQITTANKVAQSAVANLTTDLAGKAATSHTHTIANVTGLQTALDGKQASGSYAPATGIAPSAITGTAVVTTDSRLSDARTPTSHPHGNITNAGAIGATANLPVVTTTSGVLTTISAGTAGQVLTSNGGTSAPSFQTLAATSTNANNLTGGSAGTVPYQSAAGTTVMLAAGTSGQVLRSNGAAAPSWLTLGNSATLNTGTTSGTVATGDHTHTIANVTGLQTALDGKQASGSYAPATGIAPSAITGTAVVTTDSRLSDARTPTSHPHGNITNAGAIGATANLPVVTTTSGVLTTISAGTAGQVLTSNGGTSAPSFQTLAATSTNANNLTGGSAGTVPYQSAAGTTVMLAAGTSGQVLRSNGAAAPSWLTLGNSATLNTGTTSGTVATGDHTHTIANVTGLQTALDGKQAAGSYAPATGIAQSAVTNLTTDLAGKAPTSHTHFDEVLQPSSIYSSASVAGGSVFQLSSAVNNGSAYGQIDFNRGAGVASAIAYATFYQGGGIRGTISPTGASGIAYNTSSDYRLKTNLEPLTNAVARLLQIPVHRFNWLADPDAPKVDGFLAHEAQAVVPESVTGHKDEVDAEGKPIHQGIDQSKLVPLLVAAVQELAARVAALEAR